MKIKKLNYLVWILSGIALLGCVVGIISVIKGI